MATTSSTTSTSVSLALSGLASGFDWQSLVSQLIAVERTRETPLTTEQTAINNRNIAYGSLVTELNVLKNKADALKESSLYAARSATVGDTTVLSATAGNGTPTSTYTFNISQLATASAQNGVTGIGAALHSTNDVSGLVLADAAFSQAITAGTLTVNGSQITIATTDTLQGVFDNISTATSGAVTGSYDSVTDTITLSSGSPITLGSAADTSNFLTIAQLFNNGTGTVTSANALGAAQVTMTLANANFSTAVTGDGSGNGEFTINGVSITYNLNTDTVNDVLSRINASSAGVLASYDYVNDQFILTNKSTGDLGVALQDVTGNFLAASGLSTGTLSRGKNLLYTLNGGGQRVSYSNTITSSSHGVSGLSITALTNATTTVEVRNDTTGVNTAITNFVDQYNKVQSLIQSQSAITTDNRGKITTGVLASDRDITNVASGLRSGVYGQITGLSGTIDRLAALGYATNGTDNTLSLTDSAALADALATNLSGVEDFFANATTGMAVSLSSYLDQLAGDDGSLVSHRDLLKEQSAKIDDQIAAMERSILADQDRLTKQFVAMETAQARINQQLQYLLQRFYGTSA